VKWDEMPTQKNKFPQNSTPMGAKRCRYSKMNETLHPKPLDKLLAKIAKGVV